jgi:hypothetical protein
VLDAKTDNLVRDLVRLLSDLMGLHAEMVMHMRSKLEAIKTADSDRIQSITARELLLASRAREREGLRRQIAERIAEGLGIDRSRGRSMKLTDGRRDGTDARAPGRGAAGDDGGHGSVGRVFEQRASKRAPCGQRVRGGGLNQEMWRTAVC